MKGLARTGRGAERPAPSPLPNIAFGGRVRMVIGRAANDNRVPRWRRLLPPAVFFAGLLLLLAAL